MVKNLLQMSNAEYHGNAERISKSGLDLIAKSPAHYYQRYLAPNRVEREETPAFFMGTATHTAILEPAAFDAEYVHCPIKFDRRTNAGKLAALEFEAQHVGRKILDTGQYDTLMRMREAVQNHRAASQLLTGGVAEQSLFFTEPETGVKCKVRFDYLHEAVGGYVVDVKSTEDAGPEEFARSAAKYFYHKQAAFYTDALAYAGCPVAPLGFMFVAVEKTAPFGVAVYQLTEDAIELGRSLYFADLERFAECKRTGQWGAYPQHAQLLKLPRWAFSE